VIAVLHTKPVGNPVALNTNVPSLESLLVMDSVEIVVPSVVV
jgi:hypothetical protein